MAKNHLNVVVDNEKGLDLSALLRAGERIVSYVGVEVVFDGEWPRPHAENDPIFKRWCRDEQNVFFHEIIDGEDNNSIALVSQIEASCLPAFEKAARAIFPIKEIRPRRDLNYMSVVFESDSRTKWTDIPDVFKRRAP